MQELPGRLGRHDGRVDAGDQIREDTRAGAASASRGSCAAWRPTGPRARLDEVEDVLAIVAAPDVIVELDGDELDAGCERPPGGRVIGSLVPPDPVMDLEGNGVPRSAGEDRDLAVPVAAARSRVNVAMPQRRGGITGYERSTCDDAGPLDGRRHRSRRRDERALSRSGRGQVERGGGRTVLRPQSRLDPVERPDRGGPLDTG